MNKNSRRLSTVLGMASFFGLTACTPEASFSAFQITQAPSVCNPFSNGEDFLSGQHGLVARLSYIPAAKVLEPGFTYPGGLSHYQPGAPGVNTFPTEVFLNRLNVEPRYWTSGFSSSDVGLLKTSSGETLVEWFSLAMESSLIAATPNENGHYVLAVHSDDGSRVSVDTNGDGTFETLVNNDGDHASQCQSASTPIEIRTDRPLPIRIDYYQGPREAIALMLMWKKVDGPQSVNNGCPGFQRLNWDTFNIGPWSVIPARNFVLPAGRTNSCL